MSDVAQEMRIRLSREQTKCLLEWAAKITKAHLEGNCEPSGYCLQVSTGSGYPSCVEAISGSNRLVLGDVDVTLV